MNEIKVKLEQIIGRLFGEEMNVELTVPPEEMGADYATNVAMKLAKIAHKSPMVIAEDLKKALVQDGVECEIEIAVPGFMNFRLNDEYFAQGAQDVAKMLEGGVRNDAVRAAERGMQSNSKNISWDEYFGKTVVAEFSDPNPFKVLHVGHLYTSVVGDSISRILEFAGARVIRANFGGDVGLHVGKTLWAVMQHKYSFGDITIEKIAECYVEGTKAYDEDENAKAEITRLNKEIYRIAAMQREVSEAVGGEEGELAKLYWRGRELSYGYFKEFYARIGVRFDRFYPESTVADKGLEEVKAHIGTTYGESDGAIVYKGEKVGLHTRVFINTQGVPTYEAKDVGLIFTKWEDWHFDESVVITGNEQGDYMKVVLASVKEYAPELVERTRHLTHGLVKLPGNVKMSSRKGNFLKAVDVLEIVRDELKRDSDEVDERVVLAAIKYAFLKYKMGGDIIFDPKESVSTTGNSGVYLLYSTVRAKKIIEKIKQGSLNKKFIQPVEKSVENFDEEQMYVRKLNKKVVQYEEVLSGAVREKAPYKICTYLYELAQEFSRFYEHVKVAGSEREDVLGEVVKVYYKVMGHGLGLLGIEVPEEM